MQHPADYIQTFSRGEILLMPPQFYLLATLADILPSGTGLSLEAKERLKLLSNGAFGKMQINPFIIRHESDSKQSYFVYEGDEIRGGPKGRRHRSRVQFDDKWVSKLCYILTITGEIFEYSQTIRSIGLERNFDIFSDELLSFLAIPETKL
jgi:hypothetical protein